MCGARTEGNRGKGDEDASLRWLTDSNDGGRIEFACCKPGFWSRNRITSGNDVHAFCLCDAKSSCSGSPGFLRSFSVPSVFPRRRAQRGLTGRWPCLMGAAFCGLLAGSILLAQGDVVEEGPLTVFRTGGEDELLTLAMPFVVPEFGLGPVLTFDFGFSTEEPDAGQTFLDSFSVSLQGEGDSAAALLLIADRSGTSWTPENPQGVELSGEALRRAETEFPALMPNHVLKLAYSVVLAIPSVLAGGPATVFFDFIDNLNAFASLAWVANVRVGTPVAGDYALLSASDPAGPYIEETGALLDDENRRFTTSRPVGRRFYRIQGKDAVRITELEERPEGLLVHYEATDFRLEGAPDPVGPYTAEVGFEHDPTNRRFTGSVGTASRFWRIASERDTVIEGVELTGDRLTIAYDLVRLRLLAAAEVLGPYVEAGGAVIDEPTRTISMARQEAARFFRIVGNARARIVEVQTTVMEVRLKYALEP
jgi:hypothetical protein